ncbi:MAG: sulfur oxidation c-type cytochrome SoxX [Usitatibacter sp.]
MSRWIVLAATFMAGCSSTPSVNDVIDTPFAAAGDPARGREVFVAREGGHCVLCHRVPGVAIAGDVGPSLAGIGSRLSASQIRLRIADITRIVPDAAMPAFHRTEGLTRVAARYAGKPALTGQEVEDIVAWLGTLR